MKILSAILLLFSFASLTIFGFTMMGHAADHTNQNCIAAALQRTNCAPSNLAAFLAFHFNAFQNVSSAIFANNLTTILLLIILLILTLWPKIQTLGIALYPYQPVTQPIFLTPNARRKLNTWLALRENSPANF